MEDDFQPVSRQDIESLSRSVETRAATPGFDTRAGIFGPASVSWKVNRESAPFLAAGRAALLQLAHPWVAAALDQHSSLRNDPLARFHNTFRVVFTMVFGSLGQAQAASRYLYQLHTRIEGELPCSVAGYTSGSRYMANEVQALVWVYATLVESALLAYECVLPPLTRTERETYYAENKILAALFGIPASALPETWSGFEDYIREMLTSQHLGVDAMAREMAHGVLHGRGAWVPVPGWYRALTASWLPEHLRAEFQILFDRREQNAAAMAKKWLPRFYRRIPPAIRFVGPYQEAQSRLSGARVNLLTSASNRFWMGQPRMMFPEQNRR